MSLLKKSDKIDNIPMRLLLSGDEYCCQYKGSFYISDHTQILINRYLACFENINVAFRTKIVTSIEDLGKYKNEVRDSRVRMCYIPFFQGPIQYAKHFLGVRKAAKEAVKDCDLAIFRLPSTTAFALWHICVSKKIPYATEIVFDCKDAVDSAEDLLSKLIWSKIHRDQVKACNNAVGVSCVTAKYLQRHYYPLNPGAPVSNYSSIEMMPDFLFKARRFPEKPQFSIIHVANQVNFNSRKGHNELIKALKIVRDHGIDAKIVFVGEDYDNGFLKLTEFAKKYKIEESVIFTGFVNRERLRELMIESDLAVLPTKAEGLPRVVIEALAMGLPCITTPVSGNPELIDKKYLIEYSDVEGFASCIIELLTNRELYESVSKSNFNKSKEYTTEVLNPRRTGFYNKLKAIVAKNNIKTK